VDVMRVAEPLGDQGLDAFAQELGSFISEEPVELLVDHEYVAAFVDDRYAVRSGLE
jgi:hypothetical protein